MILVMLGWLIVSAPVFGQATEEKMKPSRKERREAKRAEKQAEMEGLMELAEERSFVIDADFLLDRQSRQYLAAANNFVSISGDKIVIQTASPVGIGYNGLGGVTVVGRILDYQVTRSKNGKAINVTAQMTSLGMGNATVFITINGHENAQARLYGPWGRSLAFSGDIEPQGKSFRFRGQGVPF